MDKNSKECDCNNHDNHEDHSCNCDHNHEDHSCNCDHEDQGCNCDHEDQGCNCDHEDHEHEHDHDHEHDHQEPRKIYLTLTDGKKLECDVLDIFVVDDQSYIAILPSDSETAMLYGFTEDDQGPQLRNIEDDEEYKNASKAFMERQEA